MERMKLQRGKGKAKEKEGKTVLRRGLNRRTKGSLEQQREVPEEEIDPVILLTEMTGTGERIEKGIEEKGQSPEAEKDPEIGPEIEEIGIETIRIIRAEKDHDLQELI